MINENKFDTEIIRKLENTEILRNDETYKNKKIYKFTNNAIFIVLIMLITTFITSFLGLKYVQDNKFFIVIYNCMGLFFSLIILLLGKVFDDGWHSFTTLLFLLFDTFFCFAVLSVNLDVKFVF